MLGKGLESLIPKKRNDIDKDAGKSNFAAGDYSTDIKDEDDFSRRRFSPVPHDDSSSESSFVKRSHHHKSVLGDAIFHIEVEKIKSNPYQPRKFFSQEALEELARSIREFGILQPLVVSKIEKETESGTAVEYQLIAGERRLMAAKISGLERVPVIVKRVEGNKERLELAIIENLQRENLNPVETARAYARLQDEFGLTQREIANRLGKSREVVGNALRLLDLPAEIQDAVSEGKINESQARLLLSLESPSGQKEMFREILSRNLTVRQLRQKIKDDAKPLADNRDNQEKSFLDEAEYFELKAIEEQLKEFLNAPVKIHKKGQSSNIVISFYSQEEIYNFIEKVISSRGEGKVEIEKEQNAELV